MTEPFKKPGTEWTKEQIAHISKLADEGLSATQIGAKVGLSRNTIIGALHRHGPEGWKKIRKRTRANVGNQTITLQPVQGNVKALKRCEKRAFQTGTIYAKKQDGSVWRLPEPGMCKFIYGEGEALELCGHKALPNRSYCQTHHDFCHTNDKWLGGRPRKETRNGH